MELNLRYKIEVYTKAKAQSYKLSQNKTMAYWRFESYHFMFSEDKSQN